MRIKLLIFFAIISFSSCTNNQKFIYRAQCYFTDKNHPEYKELHGDYLEWEGLNKENEVLNFYKSKVDICNYSYFKDPIDSIRVKCLGKKEEFSTIIQNIAEENSKLIGIRFTMERTN